MRHKHYFFTRSSSLRRCTMALAASFCSIALVNAQTNTDYPLNFDPSQTVTEGVNAPLEMVLQVGYTFTFKLNASDQATVYSDFPENEVRARRGLTIKNKTLTVTPGLHTYLYIDLNQDGKFSVDWNEDGTLAKGSELIAYNYYKGFDSKGNKVEGTPGNLPDFLLDGSLPNGVYRARVKVDYDNADPAGQWGEAADKRLDKIGGRVVDFRVNIHDRNHKLALETRNGSLLGDRKEALPMTINSYASFVVSPLPCAEGYVTDEIKVKHGHNFDGPQYIHGNRQWEEYSVPGSKFTVPGKDVNGDVLLTAHFRKTKDSDYKLVFSDEFDGVNGEQPDGDKWVRCVRQGATWNRWVSDTSKDVIYLKDGNMVARAIPNPDTATDPVPMITGGIKSRGKFAFKYGKLECRAKNNPWIGNFPAIWLMPEDDSAGWPACGEVDIFEAIDAQETAWHTIHSHWTYDLGNKTNPASAFNESVSMDRYHTYGLEWDETTIKWFVDGRQVGFYTKSTNQSDLNQGQWPFNKLFYIILNQSVGNGSWAAGADVSHTYEMQFDWIRVYQKPGQENLNGTVGLESVVEEHDWQVCPTDGGVQIVTEKPMTVAIYDLEGRCVYQDTIQQSATVNLPSGLYIVNNRKVMVR